MKAFIWGLEIIALLIGTFVTAEYFNVFLIRRKGRFKWLPAAVWGSYALAAVFILRLEGGAAPVVCIVAAWLIISFFMYEKNIKKKISVIAVCFCLEIVLRWIVAIIMEAAGSAWVSYGVFSLSIVKIVDILVLQIVKNLYENSLEKKYAVKYWCMCILITAGSLLLIRNLFILAGNPEGEEDIVSAAAVIVLILGMNLISFVSSVILREREKQVERQNLTQEQQKVIFNIQNEETEETWNELKKFRHNYANHLICLEEYLRKGKQEEAFAYVNNLLDNFKGEYGTKKIGSSFIDTFLGYKIRNEKGNNVNFQTNIVIPKELTFDETDLCIILGNAIDNAVEAVKKLREEERNIKIAIEYKRHTLKIFLENRFDGKVKKDRRGNLLTTKTNAGNHGLGIISIRKTVDRYNGFLDISYDRERFCVKVLLHETEV